MLAPALSGIISGILGFTAASYLNKQPVPTPTKSLQPAVEMSAPESLKISSAPESVVNMGTGEIIVPMLQRIKMNDYCNILYSKWHKCPLMVHEFLTKDLIDGGADRGSLNFKADQDIKNKNFRVDQSYYSQTDAYEVFKFDKGHMASAANYKKTPELMKSTFTYANAIPQNSSLNRSYWKNLEKYGRDLLNQEKCASVEVFSGPIYQSYQKKIVEGKPKDHVYNLNILVLKENGLMVPPQFYKIYKCNTSTGSYVSGFVVNNSKPQSKHSFSDDQVSIDEIQNRTGLQFNFKEKIISSLTEYDPQGTSKLY